MKKQEGPSSNKLVNNVTLNNFMYEYWYIINYYI